MSDIAHKTHVALGASGASRWMNCPGSVRMATGMPDYKTDSAREGTAAHAVGEISLKRGIEPDALIAAKFHDVEISEEMAEHVGVYVRYCRKYIDAKLPHWIEQPITLASLNPPQEMRGTPDFTGYDPVSQMLEVVDLKYGRGVVVEVKGNVQTRYYALGALLKLGKDKPVRWVRMTIVQPRVAHPDGLIRSETIALDDLLGFAGDLMDAARATMQPDAPLVPGSHCRWCKAVAVCPAQREQAQALAQIEFDNLPVDRPPAPSTLPVEVLADMLSKAPILEDWLKSMYAHAEALLAKGIEVPGFKLVARRPTRRWNDEEQVIRWLEARGYKPEDINEKPELRSPAQIEKVMGKQKKELPEEFIVKRSSGHTLVPESDARPALNLTAGSEFAALPAGETE